MQNSASSYNQSSMLRYRVLGPMSEWNACVTASYQLRWKQQSLLLLSWLLNLTVEVEVQRRLSALFGPAVFFFLFSVGDFALCCCWSNCMELFSYSAYTVCHSVAMSVSHRELKMLPHKGFKSGGSIFYAYLGSMSALVCSNKALQKTRGCRSALEWVLSWYHETAFHLNEKYCDF